FTGLGDADNVVAELLGVGLGHSNILPGRPGRASQIRCHLLVHQPPMMMNSCAIRAQRTLPADSRSSSPVSVREVDSVSPGPPAPTRFRLDLVTLATRNPA